MELTAVIEAIKYNHCYTDYLIHSDSMYVINCAMGKWARKKNVRMWDEFDKVNKNIKWKWTKAHNGEKYNERCNFLAKQEAKNVIKKNKKYLGKQ